MVAPSWPALKTAVPGLLFWPVCALCFYQCLWIAVYPASWLAAFSRRYADYLHAMPKPNAPSPDDVLTKYDGQALVALLHHLPSLVWAALMPLQLTTWGRGPRSAQQPRTFLNHKRTGYVAATCAALLSAAVWVMQRSHLSARHSPGSQVPIPMTGRWLGEALAQRGMAAWFVLTLLVGIMFARQGQYGRHRAWMGRHVAAGVWVMVQRWIMIACAIAGEAGLVDWKASGRTPEENNAHRGLWFDLVSLVAFTFCACVCEMWLWRERRQTALLKRKLA